eukprot:4804113-Pyramimonas_sp.AAC.1
MSVKLDRGYTAVCIGDANERQTPFNSWMVKTETVDGVEVVKCNKQDKKFCSMLKGHFAMHDYLVKLRNKAADLLMHQADVANDPLADDGDSDDGGAAEHRVPKRPRKDCIDDIPNLITLDVVYDGGARCSIRVVPEANPRRKLRMELTKENINLLTKQPDDTSHDEFIPDLDGIEHVVWLTSRSSVQTTYYSETFGRWCTKSMKVRAGPDMQERVTRAANSLAFFRSEHHHEPDQ